MDEIAILESVNIDLTEARLDKAARVVRNMVLLTEFSRNAGGRQYSLQARRSAAKLLEGGPMFIDHGVAGKNRSVLDLAGHYRGVRLSEDGRVYGDLNYMNKYADLIEDVAVNKPPNVGGSFVGAGRVSRKVTKGRQLVEDVTKASSVDLVVNPATTKNLFEHTQGKEVEKDMEWKDITLEDLKENCSDLFTEIEKTVTKAVTAKLSEQDTGKKDGDIASQITAAMKPLQEAVEKNTKALEEKVENIDKKLYESDKAAAIQKAITGSKLEPDHITDSFLKTLGMAEAYKTTVDGKPHTVTLEEAVATLVRDREVVAGKRTAGVTNFDKPGGGQTKLSEAELKESVRARLGLKSKDPKGT